MTLWMTEWHADRHDQIKKMLIPSSILIRDPAERFAVPAGMFTIRFNHLQPGWKTVLKHHLTY